MKLLIALIFALAAAVGFVHFLAEDTGYVLLAWHQWQFESSVAFLIVAVVIALFTVFIVFKLLAKIVGLIPAFNQRRSQKKKIKARESLVSGLLQMSEGQWSKAEKTLVTSAADSDTPIVNYLAAAQVSQLQGNNEKRDEYLALVSQENPASAIAVNITQVENLIEKMQWSSALNQLTELAKTHPKHRRVLELQQKVLEKMHDWTALKNLIPTLKKQKIVDKKGSGELELLCIRGLLSQAVTENNAIQINNLWDKLNKSQRTDSNLVLSYTTFLNNKGDSDAAAKLISNALNKRWDADLVQLYGQTYSTHINQQIKQAQTWLKQHPEDADLLLALGRLCAKDKNWANAQAHLDHCAQIKPTTQVYGELAQLMLATNRQDDAVSYFQKGMAPLSSATMLTISGQAD